MNDRMKIGIMAQCGGIVPAIYGGAVESLLTMIIDEKTTFIRETTILVYSDWHAEHTARKYVHSNAVFEQWIDECPAGVVA